MSDSLVPGKTVAKKKTKTLSDATVAFRGYERVSMYLATQGDFDFTLDDNARECFYDDDHETITDFMVMRFEHAGIAGIPKGSHIIPGLQVRTDERMRLFPVKS